MALPEAIANALRLLNYAAENAKPVPPDVILAITTANDAQTTDHITPDIEASFWTAFLRLSDVVEPVTVESLSAEAARTITSERRLHSWWSIVLLACILPLSVATFATSSLISALDDKATAACKSEPTLKCASPALAGVPGDDPPDFKLSNQSDLEEKYQLMYFRLRWLDVLLGTDLYAYPLGDLAPILTQPKKSDGFNKAVWYAIDLKERAQLLYGIIGNYILPVLYAMLGAVAYGLRNLSDHVATRTVVASISIRSRVRFRLAILSGVVVGLFTDFTKGIALSPLAVAFLVGYAVEIFFSFLDAVVEASKKVRGAN